MELTQSDIEKGLRALGLRSGQAVEVHSSLRSFGRVEGGADTVANALLAVVGPKGAVLMSNYPLSRPLPLNDEERAAGIGWKLRLLAEDSNEKTATGAVSDAFRRRAGVLCGSGIHRVCAWGRDAERHAQGYQHLRAVDGHALLLGVGIDRCSSMHLAEEVPLTATAREKIQRRWPTPSPRGFQTRKAQYPPDIIVGPAEPKNAGNPWKNARDEAERKGLIKKGTIGHSTCQFFKLNSLLPLLEEIRRQGPFPAPP